MKKTLKSGYKGYKAYQFLEPGVDYTAFELAAEGNEFGEYIIDLTPEQEEFYEHVIAAHPMISLHEHPFCFPKHIEQTFDQVREGRSFTAYRALAESTWDCVFDNLMDGCCMISSKHGWKWNDVIYDLGMRLADIAHQDFLIKCEKVDDIFRAKAEGKVAWVPVVEGAAMLENEVDRVDVLYGMGVRLMGITYSESNGCGSGLKEKSDGGLTFFGAQVVERMNKVGMAIDAAHVGDKTTMDIIECSKKPIFISHTGARALWNSNRLKPDSVLRACADKGGVIGIEAAPHTTITEKNPLWSTLSMSRMWWALTTSPSALTRCTATMWDCTTPLRPASPSSRHLERRTQTAPPLSRRSRMCAALRIPPRRPTTSCAGSSSTITARRILPRSWAEIRSVCSRRSGEPLFGSRDFLCVPNRTERRDQHDEKT